VNDSSKPTSLEVPFSLDALREDILNVFLLYVRNIAWMTDQETAWTLTKAPFPADGSLMNPEENIFTLGLTWNHISNTSFAQCMEHLYDFAFYGRIDGNFEEIGRESQFEWIAYLVFDAIEGNSAHDWSEYGFEIYKPLERCVFVIELANARRMLDGYECFCYRKNDDFAEDYLTVRQLALLSGMEEMSIRAAANPKRANPLKTVSDNGRTRIEIAVAEEWLKSKNKFIPITVYWPDAEIDLTKKGFKDLEDLNHMLNSRYKSLCVTKDCNNINKKLGAIGIETGIGVEPYLLIDENLFNGKPFVYALAEIFSFPQKLFLIRVQEVLTIEMQRMVQKELKREIAELSR